MEARNAQLATPLGTVDASTGASAHSPLRLEALEASEDRLLTGVPYLEGTISVAGADAIVHLSLVVEGPDGATRTLDAQVTPLRQAGPVVQAPFGLELGGVATELGPGDTVSLEISTNDLQYYANGERLPGTVLLEDLTLDLPIESAS